MGARCSRPSWSLQPRPLRHLSRWPVSAPTSRSSPLTLHVNPKLQVTCDPWNSPVLVSNWRPSPLSAWRSLTPQAWFPVTSPGALVEPRAGRLPLLPHHSISTLRWEPRGFNHPHRMGSSWRAWLAFFIGLGHRVNTQQIYKEWMKCLLNIYFVSGTEHKHGLPVPPPQTDWLMVK